MSEIVPIEFGPLPVVKSGRHWRIADTLRLRPGDWARVDTRPSPHGASGMVRLIGRGLTPAYHPPGSFEATARGADVWARHIGEVSQ